ncbi:Hsp70 family protein [Micromonospora sp. WMMD1102]|uniref:Hsp70 family protein n=1 Tax=Micromonospora sp. WMMD1102 TaxID=3016105 RepID=UPI0024151D93|nr:Hsp70 family protein [Micromonospora sp. WMMD1102]MDG4786782.1 Hsp70 family protein [Micromonospora sp. WMMD1102]
MAATPPALGIDFGTSHTVAALRMPGDRIESLLFDASPLLPSAVLAQPDGHLLVGHDALRGARLDPGRLEPNPKRRIDDGTLLLGEVETPVGEAVRAVLARVAETAQRALGVVPRPVVLTHPASWGVRRRTVLAEAATGAGLGSPGLVAEPVAAAMYFTEVLGHRVRPGDTLVVYDLGGGTFDVSAVRRRTDGGWAVLATAGLDDVGGVDVDAAIVDWIIAHQAVEVPARDTALVALRWWQLVRQEARAAKEQLSRVASASMVLPGLDRDIHLTREEFERLARPLLDRTVALTTSTLAAGGVAADRLAGVFLVGGSSRIPLVATMLHRMLGVPPTVIDQPELVVAHGSLRTMPEPASAAPGPPPSGAPGPPVTAPEVPAGALRPPVTAPGGPSGAPLSRVTAPGVPAAVPVSPTAAARRPMAAVAAVLLLGAVLGATMTAYPLVATYDGPIPYWTDRYAWQLLPVAGVLAGLWTRRRGAALAAQAVAGVVAGIVGLAVERADRNIFRLPWGTPEHFYFWDHNPDLWFVALVGGCLVAGLATEAALAVTARLASRGLALAVVVAAGMLPSPLLLLVLDWSSRPPLSRVAVDTLFAYPFVLLLVWPAAWLAGRPSQ